MIFEHGDLGMCCSWGECSHRPTSAAPTWGTHPDSASRADFARDPRGKTMTTHQSSIELTTQH
jgi:hypothetical protein